MKKIIKQGNIKKKIAVCHECGTEFTFCKSDIEKRVNEHVYSSTPIVQFVTCPICNEEIHDWEDIDI